MNASAATNQVSTSPLDESIDYEAPSSLTSNNGGQQGRGLCPSGTMDMKLLPHVDCPGFIPSTKIIQIMYTVPSGIQLPYHENPGNQFSGTNRLAYLPDNPEGRRLLKRFKSAWSLGHMFTIGTSLTTGQENIITWARIPHKTSLYGGPFGWPDPNHKWYFTSCHHILDSLGVPDEDANPTITIPPPLTCSNKTAILTSTEQKNHVVRNETISYQAPSSLAKGDALSSALCQVTLPPPGTNDEEEDHSDCPICLEELSHLNSSLVSQIKDCQHTFHQSCIEECLNREPKCPICRKPVGEPQGRSPSGTMSIQLMKRNHPGDASSTSNYISMTYHIPSGIQHSFHENPDRPYAGAIRTAYLANSDEGRRLLSRLRYAFTHGLIFRIGTSLTSGQTNVVTWTSIHHKTSIHGGPHGLPDANYIPNCNESLDALHVPDADSCCL
uniref:RING-type E3 ubiquitin transferase n=1 Tax=Attheya septentrionalis TaxID=420275 RepID=A0A7S2XP90_9STRA|mmetsp:Transcript_17801/g.32225  ORF Transcript_17801/g.32225 Transcript_17801/m.32225 type:complete len:441 (+) Transcript_17801:32-1354(+)